MIALFSQGVPELREERRGSTRPWLQLRSVLGIGFCGGVFLPG